MAAEAKSVRKALISVDGIISLDVLSSAGFSLGANEESEEQQQQDRIPFMCNRDHSAASTSTKDMKKRCCNHERDLVDAEEVFDMIRDITDPEHPLSLEQLNVVSMEHVIVKDNSCRENAVIKEDNLDDFSSVDVRFTPTIPHCSMATLIGLSIRVKLLRSLPSRFKITVRINPGTHASENAVNRQLNDKERVAAALENKHLLGVVNKCLAGASPRLG